jgi:preprotein translocase subunit SecE
MGRILKKKDPIKKKAQRAATEQKGAEVSKNGAEAAVIRPVAAVRKSAGADKPKAVPTEPGVVQKSTQFLREVKIELKKVTWPTRKQTMGSTVVVVILVVIIALFLGLVDLGLSGLIRVVLP